MSHSDEPKSEKRGNARRPSSSSVRLQIKSQDLEAVHRNVSSSGALIVTSDDLLIELVREDESGRTVVPAKIVRFEKLPGDCVGIAVEYLE